MKLKDAIGSVLRIWFVVLFSGSMAGVVDTVIFYPADASVGVSWSEWLFLNWVSALVVMSIPGLVYSILLMLFVVGLKRSSVTRPKMILHTTTATSLLAVLVLAGDPFVGDIRSFNHVMMAGYFVISLACNVIACEMAWKTTVDKFRLKKDV